MAELHKFPQIRHAAPQSGWQRYSRAGREEAAAWRRGLCLAALAFVLVAIIVSTLLGGNISAFVSPAVAAPDAERARFTLCRETNAKSCIIDGDTFRYRGRTVRIADIDTPEVRDFACVSEKARGEAATRRLATLMNAGPFTLAPYARNTDKYGRLLRVVTRDGSSLGMQLVAEGHARVWDGARHSWC